MTIEWAVNQCDMILSLVNTVTHVHVQCTSVIHNTIIITRGKRSFLQEYYNLIRKFWMDNYCPSTIPISWLLLWCVFAQLIQVLYFVCTCGLLYLLLHTYIHMVCTCTLLILFTATCTCGVYMYMYTAYCIYCYTYMYMYMWCLHVYMYTAC